MNRFFSWVSALAFLLAPLFAHAYVGMPLAKLTDKGILLSALPGNHKQAITLTATAPRNIQLFIALDGNVPTASQIFDHPITLTQTTPVTIALEENGKRSDTLYCGTYLIGFSSILPISSLILPPADLFDPARGIYVGGLTPTGDQWGNCWGSQERQAFFELFTAEENALSQGVGLKIFGGMTRQNAEKSLRIIARKKYGKGKFKYRVFPTKKIDEFNSLILRISGNDWMGTRFQDMMISSLAKDMDLDYMAYQPSVLFVNGQYWGIHNIREKVNIEFLENNHQADPEQTNLIQGLGSGATHGSANNYKELFNFLSTHAPNETGFIDSVEKRMDIDNYFRYLCLQIYIRNLDSRGNVRYWQAKNLDNRFRWIYYDGDLGFGSPGADYLKDRLSPVETSWHNPPATTFLLRHLTANPFLRDRFISQYCTLLSTWLHADTVRNRVEFFKSWFEPEIERHLQRKNFHQSKRNWLSHVNQLIRFAEIRTPITYEHLKSNFDLGDRYKLSINAPIPSAKIRYQIERIPVPSLPYQGIFFKDARVNIRVEHLHPRYRFVGWENGSTEENRILLNPTDTLVTISARVEETPASPLQGKIWINSIGHGKKDQPVFIELNGWNKQIDSAYLIDSRKTLSIPIVASQLPLVIVEDSLAFRKQFPTTQVSLLQYSDLRFKQMGETLYLLESSGAWIDSIDMLPWDSTNRKKPYWVRSDSGKLAITQTPPTFSPPSILWYKRPLAWMILGGLTLLGLVILVFRKRKQKDLVVIMLPLMILFSSWHNAHGQNENNETEKFRRVEVEVLRQSPLVFTGSPRIQFQSSFYRTFQAIDQPLLWVAPFAPQELAIGNWYKSYTVESFKEMPNDNFRSRHMKFTDRTARCWIAGVRKDFFLIDTVKKIYLARIEHSNGTESWYYPLVNPTITVDERIPGSILGATGGFYYWQLRYRSCSLLASAIVESNGQPDPKGFVIENLCPMVTDPEARAKNFSKALFQKITEQGLNADWEKALEDELKKQE